jgi:HisA/HisF family protein
MRIIPVLDILSGVTVRAVAGRRAEYRPLVTPLAASADPRDVADGIFRKFGLSEFYLADLDAIAGAEPAWEVFADLRRSNFRLWVDAGVRKAGDAKRLADAGIEVVVAGLETLAGPAELWMMIAELGPDRVAFSLDMMGGQLLGDSMSWGKNPISVAEKAVECGTRRMILLDLARVGVGGGTGTESPLKCLTEKHPKVDFVVGGGIGGAADMRKVAGASAVLVASALHDGRIESLSNWQSGSLKTAR